MLLDFMDVDKLVETKHMDALDLLKSLEANSVDLILTDPPYGISYQSNFKKGKTAPIAQDWEFQIGPFFEEMLRVLRPGSAAFIFTRWDVYPLWAQAIPKGLALKNLIVWVKNNHSAGDLEGNFGFKWEALMFLTKGVHKRKGHRWPNVWEFDRVPSTSAIHPAEKPVSLLQRAIEASTNKGDLVVDPFCGSGSTGEAAVLSGRRALLCDVDMGVLSKARQRLGLEVAVTAIHPPALTYQATPATLCMDPLEGVHPEDIAWLVEEFRRKQVV